MTRRLLGLATIAVLLVGLGCASDPTESLNGGIAGVRLSLSAIQVDVGDSTVITAESTDEQGNTLPTLPEVSSLDPTVVAITLADRPPLDERRFFIKALTFGVGRAHV